jgi:hypothetical protein
MMSGDPVASSVDDAAESSFGASRTPYSTQGTEDESAWPGLHHVPVWHLDLLVHELYHPIAFRMVGKCFMPSRVQVLVHTADVNCVPLSVVTVAGRPKHATQLAMKASGLHIE